MKDARLGIMALAGRKRSERVFERIDELNNQLECGVIGKAEWSDKAHEYARLILEDKSAMVRICRRVFNARYGRKAGKLFVPEDKVDAFHRHMLVLDPPVVKPAQKPEDITAMIGELRHSVKNAGYYAFTREFRDSI